MGTGVRWIVKTDVSISRNISFLELCWRIRGFFLSRWSHLIQCLPNCCYQLFSALSQFTVPHLHHAFTVSQNNFPRRKNWILLPFCHFPLKYLIKARMCNRCPLLIFPCNLNAWDGSPGGGHYASWLSVLMGHSSAVELQMRRKGGLVVDRCFFHMRYLCLWWLLSHCVFDQQTAQNTIDISAWT